MFKFKVVSTGQKTGNLNEDPKLRIYPEVNRFKLNLKAANLIAVNAGEAVTVLVDTDNQLIAIHKAIPKVNAEGNVMMKVKRLTNDQKAELDAKGEAYPEEIDYSDACKLSGHLEFSSGNTMYNTGLKGEAFICDLDSELTGEDIGNAEVSKVIVFNYSSAEEEAEEIEPEEK